MGEIIGDRLRLHARFEFLARKLDDIRARNRRACLAGDVEVLDASQHLCLRAANLPVAFADMTIYRVRQRWETIVARDLASSSDSSAPVAQGDLHVE